MKHSKAVGALGVLSILLLVSVYASAVIHSFLSEGAIYSNLNPIETIYFVFSSKAAKFFWLFAFLSVIYIIHLFWIQKIYRVDTDLIEVTPEIKTPVAAGNGEYGTAKWLPKNKYGSHFSMVKIPLLDEIDSYKEGSCKTNETTKTQQ